MRRLFAWTDGAARRCGLRKAITALVSSVGLLGLLKWYSTRILRFATLREDGPVVVWGKPSRHLTQDVANRLHNIVQVEETCWQYAALRADGIVII